MDKIMFQELNESYLTYDTFNSGEEIGLKINQTLAQNAT